MSELRALAGGVAPWGRRPAPQVARRFSADEWLLFLGELPQCMTQQECAWLDDAFHLTDSSNAEILCKWLVMAAASGYEPVYPRIREFLGAVGRMKFLKPLYKTLTQSQRTRAMARDIFAAYAERYHPIARAGLEGILRAA